MILMRGVYTAKTMTESDGNTPMWPGPITWAWAVGKDENRDRGGVWKNVLPQIPHPKSQPCYSLWVLVREFGSSYKFVTRLRGCKVCKEKPLPFSFSQTSRPPLLYTRREMPGSLGKIEESLSKHKALSVFTMEPKTKLKMTISNWILNITSFLKKSNMFGCIQFFLKVKVDKLI